MTDMLDVAGPQYEDGDVTNERIAQRCGFGEPDTLRRAFLRRFGVAPREHRSYFHSRRIRSQNELDCLPGVTLVIKELNNAPSLDLRMPH